MLKKERTKWKSQRAKRTDKVVGELQREDKNKKKVSETSELNEIWAGRELEQKRLDHEGGI